MPEESTSSERAPGMQNATGARSAGTGQASSTARTASETAVAGSTGSATGSIAGGVVRAGEQLSQQARLVGVHAADEPGQHRLPVTGLPEHLVHQLRGVVRTG